MTSSCRFICQQTTLNKLHSWLSEDIGLRGALVHLGMVVGLMKINTDY